MRAKMKPLGFDTTANKKVEFQEQKLFSLYRLLRFVKVLTNDGHIDACLNQFSVCSKIK